MKTVKSELRKETPKKEQKRPFLPFITKRRGIYHL